MSTAATTTTSVRDVLRGSEVFGPEQVEQLRDLLAGAGLPEARAEVSALQAEARTDRADEGTLLRAGVASFLLGQHREAEQFLARCSAEPTAYFYHGMVLLSLERFAEAAEMFEEAATLGHDPIACTLERAGCLRKLGQLEEAEQTLRSVAKDAASRADYSFQMGCILADRGDSFGAIEYFERAVDMDKNHSRALFWLASENALRGNDDEAIRLYEQSLSRPPYYLGALINLGLLYEDSDNYPAAAYCFRKVIQFDPRHERAHLYLKDIEATADMYYDEESARMEARLAQLLSRPITDFELSVRARNCLEAMDIHTLGDLTEVTEQELLGGKNFGETSLTEIREIMAQHGLQIGQNIHRQEKEPTLQFTNLSPEEQAVMGKPIAELDLSVRARKCMARLGITTVGELSRKTADELLGSRNFGVTSLNEVRSKLAELNLSLRNE